MERSTRSTPTGRGSRGGKWGKKPPAEYWRDYRATHPEYVARSNERRRRHRAQLLDNRPPVMLSDVVRALIAEGTARSTGAKLGVAHTSIWRARNNRDRRLAEDTIDIIVHEAGISKFIATWRKLKKQRTQEWAQTQSG